MSAKTSHRRAARQTARRIETALTVDVPSLDWHLFVAAPRTEKATLRYL